MGIIHKLSKETISQIAAGQVIERPAFIVKELVDNAIDARSTDIYINLDECGLSKIEVIDNGIGMAKDDLILSIEPHTTSKISEIIDIEAILTLGFRGEALSSIQSVCDLEISTKRKEDTLGYHLTLADKKQTIKKIGKANGTTVISTNLFKNIPARKKFLKSKQQELRLIVDIISNYCFAYPNISFKLSNNGRVLIDETSEEITERVEHLWGEDVFSNLLQINYDANFFTFSGYLGKPQISITNASKLLTFVNNRPVSDKIITNAIKDAYGTLLMARAYPVGIIFVSIPQQFVDINVHPTKREIRFSNPKEVYDEVYNGVVSLLSKHNLTYQNVSFKQNNELKTELKKDIAEKDIASIGKTKNEDIFQIHDSYLVSETNEGIQVVDQHAAHESLLYFEFLESYRKKSAKKFTLPSPVIVNFTISQAIKIDSQLNNLKQIGFEIEDFGNNSYRVTHCPYIYKDQNIKVIVEKVIESMRENKKSLLENEHLMLATLACKSAIKAGQFLSYDQRRKIMDSLTSKHEAYTCPHGRPVKINITLNELARLFKRK